MHAPCHRCGTADGGGRFCGHCGAHLGSPASAAPRDARLRSRPASGAPGRATPSSGRAAPSGPSASPAARGRGPGQTVLAVLAAAVAIGGVALWASQDAGPVEDEVTLPADAEEQADGTDEADESGEDGPTVTAGPSHARPPTTFRCQDVQHCDAWRVPLDGEMLAGAGVTAQGHVVVAGAGPTGRELELLGVTPEGSVRWRRQPAATADRDGGADRADAPPLRLGGVQVAGDMALLQVDDRVIAVDGADGATRWTVADVAEHAVLVDAALIGDTVLLHLRTLDDRGAAEDPGMRLLAVDAASGRLRWSARGRAASVTHGMVSLLDDGELRRLSPRSGEPRWRRDADWLDDDDRVGGVPGVHPGLVGHLGADTIVAPVPDEEDHFLARGVVLLDAGDGRELARLDGQPVGPVTGEPPLLLRTPDRRALAAYDERGRRQWQHRPDVDGRGSGDRTHRRGNHVLITGHGRRPSFELLDVHEGRLLREGAVEADDARVWGLLGPSTLHVGSDDAPTDTTAMGVADLRARWRVEGMPVFPGLVEGLVLIGPVDGELIAVEVE